MKRIHLHRPFLFFTTMAAIVVFTSFATINGPQEPREKPTTHEVTIFQMKFKPESITVKNGDIIKWINKDIVPHDVTEKDKKWSSGPLDPGETFSKKVAKGFDYYCSLHLVMKGSVKVR